MKMLLSASTLLLMPIAVFASSIGGEAPMSVPEPGTLGLLALGVAGAAYAARRRRRK